MEQGPAEEEEDVVAEDHVVHNAETRRVEARKDHRISVADPDPEDPGLFERPDP